MAGYTVSRSIWKLLLSSLGLYRRKVAEYKLWLSKGIASQCW
jgi:hypothetical protein